ncbi:MAG: hypothetical protein AB1500_12075 [Bacillota bacterium]
MEKDNGSGNRQELRQVLRDVLDFQTRNGVDGEHLLLLLSLVNVFGVIDLIRKKQGVGEGQNVEQLMGSFMNSIKGSSLGGEEETGGPPALRAVPGGKSLMGLLGGNEGVKALTDLMKNKEFMENVVPAVMQRFTGAPSPKEPETEKETPVGRRGRGREVIHWDFGRSETVPEKDGAV